MMSMSDKILSCYKRPKEEDNMSQTKKDKRISVRLDPEASQKLEDAKAKGYTQSQYINDIIKETVIADLGQYRKLLSPLCELESLLEHEKSSELKNAMRGEVNKLWRCLKSFPETT